MVLQRRELQCQHLITRDYYNSMITSAYVENGEEEASTTYIDSARNASKNAIPMITY